MKKPRTLSPVERAVIAAQWRQNVATSRIHAMMGDDIRNLLDQAGKVIFVVLGAAMVQNVPANDPDVRILRGSVNALHDQAGEPEIDPVRRKSISAGLEAAVRMLEDLPYPAVVKSACDLHLKLRAKDGIALAEFQELVAKMQPA